MNDPLKSALGQNLVRFRKEMGLTQTQIAELIGIDRSRYAHYEKDTTPTAAILRKIASIFNVSLDDLLYPPRQVETKKAFRDIALKNVDAPPFTELRPEEKELILKFRLLSIESKKSTKNFVEDRLNEEEDD